MLRTFLFAFAVVFGGAPSYGQYLGEEKDEDGVVYHIHFSGESEWLAAQVDPKSHWHQLPGLEWVTFNNFEVSPGALRYALSLKRLKELNLGIGPEGIGLINPMDLDLLQEADHLEALSLCFRDIGNDHLRFLPGMEGLESLEVSGDNARLTDEVALHLVSAPKLRWIQISSGGFTDEFVRLLSAKRELESLSIRSPRLTDASLATIGGLTKMRSLRIVSPLLTDEGVRSLRGLAELEELEIESPKITSSALTAASSFGHLTYLELSLETVRPEDLAALQKLKSLKRLALRKVSFGDEEFSALRGHPSLESLFFEKAELTEKVLPVIESLKKLENVAFGTKTEASRRLLKMLAERGIHDLSFHPRSQ